MSRPVKWSRDVHPIRERAAHSRTETWSRQDIERLFGIGRASAQNLMKAIGEIQPVGGAHFVDRTSLLAFLDKVAAAPSIEQGVRQSLLEAQPPLKSRPLRVSLPASLRSSRMSDLPPNIKVSEGQISVKASTAIEALESLCLLALAMQNDLDRFRDAIEPHPVVEEAAWDTFFSRVPSHPKS